jgi:hypothetical protein
VHCSPGRGRQSHLNSQLVIGNSQWRLALAIRNRNPNLGPMRTTGTEGDVPGPRVLVLVWPPRETRQYKGSRRDVWSLSARSQLITHNRIASGAVEVRRSIVGFKIVNWVRCYAARGGGRAWGGLGLGLVSSQWDPTFQKKEVADDQRLSRRAPNQYETYLKK